MLGGDLRYLKYYEYEANYSAENYVDVQSATHPIIGDLWACQNSSAGKFN